MNDSTSRNGVNLNSISYGVTTIEGNCWHHLRAVWVNAASEDMAKHASKDLSTELKEIDSRLRANVKMDDVFLAIDKYFPNAANYPKGCGDAFKGHIEEYHLDHILCYVPSAKCNRP